MSPKGGGGYENFMVLFVLTVVAAFAVAAGLALIAIFVLTFVAALIAGQMRGRSHQPHRLINLIHGHH